MWATASVGHIISFPDVVFPKNGFFVTWWLSAVVFWLRRPNANVATRTSRESTCCLPKGRLRHNKREDDCSLRIRGPRAKKGRGRRFLGGGVLGEYDLGMARAARNFFLGGNDFPAQRKTKTLPPFLSVVFCFVLGAPTQCFVPKGKNPKLCVQACISVRPWFKKTTSGKDIMWATVPDLLPTRR